ncbi:hypothetical protein E4U19_002084 [Claviceps sp. Clav32 group G5]|nr:hypothetical protein E4U19_002084 [Claviceps sp. Clav32 group G5]
MKKVSEKLRPFAHGVTIIFPNNNSATKPAGSRLSLYQPRFGLKWIFVYDGLADRIQKQLSYYFESGATLEWNAVAFLNHLKCGRRVLQRVFGTVRARAHRLDAPEDEKVELKFESSLFRLLLLRVNMNRVSEKFLIR